jgi:hypothetical protein
MLSQWDTPAYEKAEKSLYASDFSPLCGMSGLTGGS